jgi:transcriptional regulator with XRE-family HTH domain
LRAYRLESGMRAEEIAARLGVSRAALYRYEKGRGDQAGHDPAPRGTAEDLAAVLLGIGVEYFSRPLAFQERLRQVEEQADQILQVGGTICYQTTTEAYDGALAEAWAEAADQAPERVAARAAADQAMGLLVARKKLHQSRRANIIAMLSETAIRRMLMDGVAAGMAVSERTRTRCRMAARAEAESIANLMESVPIGLQLGLLASEPAGNFIVLRGRERAHVCVSPFAADMTSSAGIGVGSITAADEAVAAHQRVAEAAWRDAPKGTAAASRIRDLIRETAAR